MKLSVIIPVYKAEKYLNKCVDSVLAQTCGDLEIILVNDGSPDSSADICREYAARYGCVSFINTVNGGQGRARNLGLDMCSGDYVGFVDSDDWIDPSMYEKLIGACEESGADIACCRYTRVYENGGTETEPARRTELLISAAGSCCNKVFRRDLIDSFRYPEGTWYEDSAFSAVMLLKAEKCVFLADPLYFYRIGHSSTMHNSNQEMNLDIIKIIEIIRQYIPNDDRYSLDYLVDEHILLDAVNRVSDREVVRKLVSYARQCVPDLSSSPCYLSETWKRRLVMKLNYSGLDGVSKMLLGIK